MVMSCRGFFFSPTTTTTVRTTCTHGAAHPFHCSLRSRILIADMDSSTRGTLAHWSAAAGTGAHCCSLLPLHVLFVCVWLCGILLVYLVQRLVSPADLLLRLWQRCVDKKKRSFNYFDKDAWTTFCLCVFVLSKVRPLLGFVLTDKALPCLRWRLVYAMRAQCLSMHGIGSWELGV